MSHGKLCSARFVGRFGSSATASSEQPVLSEHLQCPHWVPVHCQQLGFAATGSGDHLSLLQLHFDTSRSHIACASAAFLCSSTAVAPEHTLLGVAPLLIPIIAVVRPAGSRL
jgi:hypothetical protein